MESQSRLPNSIHPRYKILIGITAAMTLVSTLFVSLRLASRILSVSIKWDDWASVGALAFAYGVLIITILDATVGRKGYHLKLYDPTTLSRALKILLAKNLLYRTSTSLAKLAVLLFYHRIFTPSKPFLYSTLAMGAVVIGFWLSTVFGLIFAYNPVEAQWEPWLPHTSIHNKAFWVSEGIINMALDVEILIMPQPLVWRLKMSRRRKLLLSGLFTLGGFVCIASILRVYYLAWADTSDLTYTFYNAGIWTVIEVNLSIISGCLPLLPNLVRAFRHRQGRGVKFGIYGESRVCLRQLDAGYSIQRHREPLPSEEVGSR